MALPQLKYNPGVRGDQELIDGFVVRHQHLELILEVVRENTAGSNQHLLIVGPRGSGKTTLVRRVAAEIRKDPALAADWYPIVFAEESYLISSPGELWLETLFHLGEQTRDERWDRAYQELRKELDEDRLRQSALAQLMDFATESGKRVLLIVENMNILLGEQMKGSGDWDLRHTLLNESRVMLLGTATSRFEGVEKIDRAWFELFAIHELLPLDAQECHALWRAVTGEQPSGLRLRPMQILTGGNPRLLKILAEFAATRSFRELASQLVQLVDQHTEYFKSHLDRLAPQERKVFVALLDLWDPVSAQDVARAARLSVSKVSSLLNRLVSRGSIQVVEQRGRRNIYQASERLFNIYYLMRRRGHQANRVRALVVFMTHFYSGEHTPVIRQLAAEGDWQEALKAAKPAVRAAGSNEAAAKLATEILMSAAAAGHAEEALRTLAESEGAEALEPLEIGLTIFTGESPARAREILDVGRDVAQRIRELQGARRRWSAES